MTAMNTTHWSADTAETRLEQAFKLADEPKAQSVFTKLLPDRAREQAKKAGGAKSPLAGALVSVKALFDLKGETTTSAAKVLQIDPPASQDAPSVVRLDEAGAVFVGLTNMSEFAYSGLGLNPHYGTPQNPIYPGCAPGGSTSGGAVSVALGLADIAIGSDTGGSLRIPAAFCGITGFKPSQASVSLEGGNPLSDSLDSFGPMARTVSACELAWQVMSGQETSSAPAQKARLVVPRNFGFTEVDQAIAEGFKAVVSHLRKAGFDVVERDLTSCADLYNQVPPWHMTSVESRAHYETHFQNSGADMDQRVHARMGKAEEISAIEYRQTLNRRQKLIADFATEVGDDLLILPTTPILPPKLSDLEDDANFNRLNLLALRNPSLANVTDACSIALPYKNGALTLSAMLVAPGGQDHKLLAVAKSVEAELARLS
ncbi:glutamyl-tRNA(Gln) amidotransferase subunit A [Roseibium sp. TrichSKD4]|uniref:amidase family protein n=1 Tax=Roseibium sp. TrichSKD4 TaxID=744980 RepID=UPI0001E565CE|nr:amidase family protein [Roseibium sp. TrichSKD4]EFO34239.1 glutamyl-tRNA(Gln) amidotransferase subunit A [Roseibium sp. TrichSKD4]